MNQVAEDRKSNGQFAKGHKRPGPGRKPGYNRLHPLALMREYYKQGGGGKTLEHEVGRAIERLMNVIHQGEDREAVDAAKVVFPYLLHKEPDAPLVEVNVTDDAPRPRGPTEAGSIRVYVDKLADVLDNLGVTAEERPRIEMEEPDEG